MRHDTVCEWDERDRQPWCHCAERTYLATATPDEVAAWKARRGYDTNALATWDLPPRSTA